MIDFLFDLLWPRICPCCHEECDRPSRHVCSNCVMRLPFIAPRGLCLKCGRDAVGFEGDYICDDCRQYKPFFDRGISAMRFEGVAREIVNGFKFREQLYLRNDLADYMEAAVRARFILAQIDCVTYVPITVYRRISRGFNQCEILAEELARRIGKPCRAMLKRVGNPKRQGGLTEEDRRKNIVGTFVLEKNAVRPSNRCVLLIDDIMTTGSTLSEASRILKLGGVKTVWIATLARSIRV